MIRKSLAKIFKHKAPKQRGKIRKGFAIEAEVMVRPIIAPIISPLAEPINKPTNQPKEDKDKDSSEKES